MRHNRALLALPVIAALAVPAAAPASTLSFDKSCYSRVPTKGSEPLSFTVTGGTPNGRYQVFSPEGRAGSVVGNFDAAGNARNALPDFSTRGIDPQRGRSLSLQVREFLPGGASPITGTGATRVTNAAMEISNRALSRPYSKRTWIMSGLTPLFGQGPLYATWIASGKAKATKIARLGTPDACGYLRIKRSASPVRRSGRWKIYVHVGKKLDKKKSLIWNWRVFRF